MNSRITFISASCTFAAAILLNVNAEDGVTGRAIMDKVIDNTKLAGAEQIATLTIRDDKGNVRERKFSSATKTYAGKNIKKAILRFLAPADVKGTGFLTFDYDTKDDDMWLYLPALRKTRRIVSSEKGKSFMGSEFTNSDMNMPNLDDYTITLQGNEKYGDSECWKVEMVPATEKIAEDYGYSKLIHKIGKKDHVIRHTAYYDLDGELLKELKASDVSLVDEKKNKSTPMKIEIVNKQNGRSSSFVIEKMVFNPEVKDEYFTTGYMEK